MNLISHIRITSVLIFLLIFICCSCLTRTDAIHTNALSSAVCSNCDSTVKKAITNWKYDSLGCEHFRSIEIAQSIIDSCALHSSSATKFVAVFGYPNEITQRGDNLKVLLYYTKSFCNDGIRLDGKDKVDFCVLEFYFFNDSLTKIEVSCT